MLPEHRYTFKICIIIVWNNVLYTSDASNKEYLSEEMKCKHNNKIEINKRETNRHTNKQTYIYINTHTHTHTHTHTTPNNKKL